MINDSVYAASSMRILPLLVLFIDIPFIYKLIPILLFDKVDCIMSGIINLENKDLKDVNCQSQEYQLTDKIMDTITYTVLLIYTSTKEYRWFTPMIIVLFVFRMIGVLFYLKNDDRRMLVYFPNFFLPTMIVFYLMDYLSASKIYYYLSVIPIFIYKICNEYNYHWI